MSSNHMKQMWLSDHLTIPFLVSSLCFPLRYRPLKKQLSAVEHAHECSPVKKKKKKRVDIKGRHELAHIWDQIPVIQPV